jgi:hypothetical protein
MWRTDIRHIAFASWAAVNVGLLFTVGHELGWGGHVHLDLPKPEVLAPDKVKLDLPEEYHLPPIEKGYPVTVERPLFVPTRRPAPPPPPPPPPPKPTMKKNQFQLTGVMIMPEASYAVLLEAATGKTRIVQKGQTINGILVKSVEPEHATLTQYDDTEVLTMKVQPSPKSPKAASGVQGQPGEAFPGNVARPGHPSPVPPANAAQPGQQSPAPANDNVLDKPPAKHRRPIGNVLG